jgi:microcystin-dependent protein
VVPIGAIVPWHKSLPGTPPLPPGWVECNGQVLNDSASPFHGQTVPDLNSTGRFLRGGTTSGIEQDDAVQDHGHVPGSLNIADSGAHSHSLDKYKLRNGSGFLAEAVADNAGDYAGTRNTATATHGHPAGSFAGNTGSPTAGTRTDVETRPVNMSVVWIIRVR